MPDRPGRLGIREEIDTLRSEARMEDEVYEPEMEAILAALLLFVQEEGGRTAFPSEPEYILSALAGAVYECCVDEEMPVGYHRGEKMIYPKFEGQIFKIVTTALRAHPKRFPPSFAERIEALIRPDWRVDTEPGREPWTLLYELYNANGSGESGLCPDRSARVVAIPEDRLARLRRLADQLPPEEEARCRDLALRMARYLDRDFGGEG